MKIKVMLLAVLITIFQSANAKSIEYETGKKLALCAGKSKYIAFMLKDNESYVDAEYQSLKGERYKLASAYSFNKYGMKKDSSINHASEIMNEEYLLLAIKYSDFIKMPIGKSPTTYVTTTSQDILKLVRKLGIETTPTESVITGFNGLILGYAKLNGINGIGKSLNFPKPINR